MEQTQVYDGKIVEAQEIVTEQVTIPKKKNKGILLVILVVLIAIVRTVTINNNYKINDLNPSPTPQQTFEVTQFPTDIEELTPSVPEEINVSGDGVIALIDPVSVSVYTKDFKKTAYIELDGEVLQCDGPISGYCIYKNNSIRALQISRSNKIVPTKSYPINLTDSEIAPYSPYIDLEKNKYAYMVGNGLNEMYMEFYLKDFAGKKSPLLLTHEGEGVAGYRIDSILSSGEVVMNLQGSVYNPGDPLTYVIYTDNAEKRTCDSKEFLSVFNNDFRYYTDFVFNDTNNKQTVRLKQVNLRDCREKIIDTIENVSGGSKEVPLRIFSNFLILRYGDTSGFEKFKVYNLSNIAQAPLVFTNTNRELSLTPYGYRADTKTLVGLFEDLSVGLLTTQRMLVSTNKLSGPNAARFFDLSVFVIH